MANNKPTPIAGSERIIQKFLYLPKKLKGEIKWFTTTTIKQRWTPYYKGKHIFFKWKDVNFK